MSAVNDAHAAVPSGDLGGLHQVTGGSNQDANTSDEDADSEGSEMADDSEDDYEQERQRQIQENQRLLQTLGISAASGSGSGTSLGLYVAPARSAPTTQKKRPREYRAVYDRSGHITSLPAPGQTHVVACVEIPNDRRIRKRIADGEYEDRMYWAEGEARRWRFGRGRGELGEGEEEEVGGVTAGFRWRKWKGLRKELLRELQRLNGSNDADQEGLEEVQEVPAPVVGTGGQTEPTPYSLIPGAPCHQCRRKSDKRKMKCRNLQPECKATFCETCCKRYSYFEFDPESRTFVCPLCKDMCNCATCIRKRDLAHLLDGRRGLSIKKLAMREGETMQDALQKAVKDKVGVPFERVRLVNQAEDVITPELPPLPKPPKPKNSKKKKAKVVAEGGEGIELVDGEEAADGNVDEDTERIGKGMVGGGGSGRGRGKEGGRGRGRGRGRGKGKGRGDTLEGTPTLGSTDIPSASASTPTGTEPGPRSHLPIKLKVPTHLQTAATPTSQTLPTIVLRHPALRQRVKEVDSDGDTIAGGSTDDESELTELPDRADTPSDADRSDSESVSNSTPSGVPTKRRAFPPRPQFTIDTNAYLSSISLAQAHPHSNPNQHASPDPGPMQPTMVDTNGLLALAMPGHGVFPLPYNVQTRDNNPPMMGLNNQDQDGVDCGQGRMVELEGYDESATSSVISPHNDQYYQSPWSGPAGPLQLSESQYLAYSSGYNSNSVPMSQYLLDPALSAYVDPIGRPPPYSHSPPPALRHLAMPDRASEPRDWRESTNSINSGLLTSPIAPRDQDPHRIHSLYGPATGAPLHTQYEYGYDHLNGSGNGLPSGHSYTHVKSGSMTLAGDRAATYAGRDGDVTRNGNGRMASDIPQSMSGDAMYGLDRDTAGGRDKAYLAYQHQHYQQGYQCRQ